MRRMWVVEVKEKARAASNRHTAGTRASKVPGREREDGGDVLAVLGWHPWPRFTRPTVRWPWKLTGLKVTLRLGR